MMKTIFPHNTMCVPGSITRHSSVAETLIIVTITRCILLLFFAIQNAQAFDCMYQPKESSVNPEPEPITYTNCGTISENGALQFTQLHLDNIDYGGSHKLSCIYISDTTSATGWYYRNSLGTMIKTVGIDNGCDYFVQGMVRSVVNGKTWFVDQNLNVILETPFASVSPFYDGLASTCHGGEWVKQGEYTFLEGATCAYITPSGDLATDFMPQQELPSREELGIPCVDLCN